MRNLFLLLIAITMFNCSPEENTVVSDSSDLNNGSLNNQQVLIQNSWKRTQFNVVEILDDNTSVETWHIQENLNTSVASAGKTLIYNDDNTGSFFIEPVDDIPYYENFTWSYVNDMIQMDVNYPPDSYYINNNEMVLIYNSIPYSGDGGFVEFKAKEHYIKVE